MTPMYLLLLVAFMTFSSASPYPFNPSWLRQPRDAHDIDELMKKSDTVLRFGRNAKTTDASNSLDVYPPRETRPEWIDDTSLRFGKRQVLDLGDTSLRFGRRRRGYNLDDTSLRFGKKYDPLEQAEILRFG